MTEQATNVNDIAAMLMQPESEPVNESTEGTEELEVAQTDDAEEYELEAESDGNENEDEDSDSEEPTYYAVKVDGEDMEVTLEEALAGYQRDSDYRKKTMTVAEQRKEVEAKAAAIDAKLVELDSFIKREEDKTDWEELMRSDPGEYLARKEELNKTKAAADSVRNERQAELQERQSAYIADETTKLITAMGGNDAWTTEQRTKDIGLATDYLQGMGLQEGEIAGIVDHRLWRIVLDAAKASKFSDTKTRVRKEIRKAPKSVKPGQKVPQGQRQRMKATEAVRSADGRQAQTAALAQLLQMGD